MERVSVMTDVGGITTDGILGKHFIRILSYGDEGRHYAITVDGEHRQARTERGILRCVAQMIFKEDQEKIGVWTDPDGPCPGWEPNGGEDGQP